MINGIDISKHNGTIDWAKVKASGQDFVMVRLGWAGYDGRIAGNGGLDPMFTANVEGAQAAGMDVGAYVYSYVKTAAAAKIAARETTELLKPYRLTYPVAFDFEESMYAAMTKEENTAICEGFLSTIENAGYYAMLYTFKSYAESNVSMSDLAKYDLWLAHVGANGSALASTSYKGKYGVWQYSWKGNVSGISGEVDLNYAYQDYPAIIKGVGLNGFERDDEIIGDIEEDDCTCEAVKEAIRRIKDIADEALQ